MSALREILAKFGVEFDHKQLEHGHNSIEGTIHKLEELGQVIAGSLIVEGIHRFIEGIVETGVELEHTSIRTGVAVDRLQELEYAAKLSGVGAEELDTALSRLGRSLAGAADDGGEMAKAFKRAGIDTKDASGHVRTAADVLPDIAEKFTELKNPSERAAFAMKVFGRGGAQLIPLLAKGKEGIAELAAEARDLGGGLSEEAVEGAAAMHEATAKLDFAFLSLKSRIATTLLPALTSIVDAVVKGVVWFQKLSKQSNVMQGLLAVLGGGGLAAVLRLVGGFKGLWAILGKLLFRLVLPALIIDELITTFEGGDTIIRRVIDHLFGIGATAEAVEFLKDAWDFFFDVIVPAAEDTIKAVIGGITDFINMEVEGWKYGFQLFGDAWNAIVNAMPAPVHAILDEITGAFDAAFKWIGDQISSALEKVIPLKGLFGAVDDAANAKARAEARARDGTPADPRDAAALAGAGSGVHALARFAERQAATKAVAPGAAGGGPTVINQHNETKLTQNIHGTSASPRDIKNATKAGINHTHRVAKDSLVQTAG